MRKNEYAVIVGNIGQVHAGTNKQEALTHFRDYVRLSRLNIGRGGFEDVCLMANGEPIKEYFSPDEGWTRYRVLVAHDNGKAWIKTSARNEESAIHIVMQSEGCPRSAVLKIVEVF